MSVRSFSLGRRPTRRRPLAPRRGRPRSAWPASTSCSAFSSGTLPICLRIGPDGVRRRGQLGVAPGLLEAPRIPRRPTRSRRPSWRPASAGRRPPRPAPRSRRLRSSSASTSTSSSTSTTSTASTSAASPSLASNTVGPDRRPPWPARPWWALVAAAFSFAGGRLLLSSPSRVVAVSPPPSTRLRLAGRPASARRPSAPAALVSRHCSRQPASGTALTDGARLLGRGLRGRGLRGGRWPSAAAATDRLPRLAVPSTCSNTGLRQRTARVFLA